MSDATTLPPELEAMLHNLIASAKNAAMFGTDDDTQSLEESCIALRTALASLVGDRERLDWLGRQAAVVAGAEFGTRTCGLHFLPVDENDEREAGFATHGEGWSPLHRGAVLRDAIDAARASTTVVGERGPVDGGTK